MSGKARDKALLQLMLGLREDPELPIVAIVSRLVAHKGLDLMCEVIHDMMGLPMQLVILGKGDQKYEEFFRWAGQQYPGRMAVRLDYNEALSMAIYAGADLFLMPSRSEPCGLSQMIAMRYGTVPIVRETGGLKDTVRPYEAWRDAGNGFTFANYSSGDMLYVIREAVYLYTDYPEVFGRLRQRAMSADFSWGRSAAEYLRIYAGLLDRSWPEEAAPETVPVEAAAAPEETGPEEAMPVEAAPEAASAKAAPKTRKAPAKKSAKAAGEETAPKAKKPAAKKAAGTKTAKKRTVAKGKDAAD